LIAIDNTLVSEDLLEKKFVCDLNACKGACCVEGDSGAPLEENEAHILEEIFDFIKPYMRPEGIAAIEEQGKYTVDVDGDLVTPLVKGKECAYVYFDKNNTALCAIEKAYKEGKINFQKPVSCHLYPVRITNYKEYDAVNYHAWDICKPACKCGSKLNIPVYKFVKTALIRKYGEDWYKQLEFAAMHTGR
jgi:hypothetical protein